MRHVAGHEQGATAGHQSWLDNIARPVRPAPAVVPAPPLAAYQLADDAVGTDIVGHNAIIGVASRLPGLQIIQHPLPVLVFARVEVRVGNQAGGTQVEGHVAAGHALIDLVEHLGEDTVVGPIDPEERVRTVSALYVFIRSQVPGENGAVVVPIGLGGYKARSFAAVEGRADHAVLGIPVGCQRILASVHGGVAQGAGAVNVVLGIGHGQIVDIGIALGVVKPIEACDEFSIHRAVVGVLIGDGVPLFAGDPVDVLAAAQQVEEREGEEGFIAVVRAVHAGPHRALDQGAVRAGAVRDKGVGSAVHHRYQLALVHGPIGWLLARLCCQCCTGHFTVFRVKFDTFCSLTYKTNIYHIRGCTRANGV